MFAVPPTSHRAGPPASALAIPVLAALAGALVFRGALAYDFSQDDFLGLARASGLAPRLTGVWRYVSHQAYFDLMRPMAGLAAAPYHAVSLLVHAACSALVAVLLGRLVSRPAALLGAAFFAVHPALFTAVYWISAIGDSLSLACAIGALLLALRSDRLRWVSLPLFALALLAKESTLLLPAVAWLVARRLRPAKGTGAVVAGLAAIAALHLVATVAGNAFGVRAGVSAESPYAIGVGAHIGTNALSYLGWTGNFLLPTMQGFSDAVDRSVFLWAIGLAVVWLAGLASRGLIERGWIEGGAAFVLFLMPVLPLRNHTYHYYLYAPLLGAAWCVAAAADWITARVNLPARWAIAGACAALLAVNGAIVVRAIEETPFVMPELRSDPTVDRARIARNVRESLAPGTLPAGITLLFWSPMGEMLGPHGETLPAPSPGETYWERNVREAMLDGLAVRVMFPQVRQARFVREFQPANAWYALYKPDGHVLLETSAGIDSTLRSRAAALRGEGAPGR